MRARRIHADVLEMCENCMQLKSFLEQFMFPVYFINTRLSMKNATK